MAEDDEVVDMDDLTEVDDEIPPEEDPENLIIEPDE